MLGECLKFHNKPCAVCEYVCVREVVWLCGCGNVPSSVLHMNWLWNYLIMWGCELITSACSDLHFAHTYIYMVTQPIMYTFSTQCTQIPNGVQILAGGINKKNLQTKITSVVLWSHSWIKVMMRTLIKKKKERKKEKKATQNVQHKKIKRKSDFRLTKNSAKSLEMMFDGYTVFRHISLTHLWKSQLTFWG